MSREQYWDGDPMDVAAYREADRLRADRENRVAWLNGLYVYQALGAMAPLLNAFSKRSQAREYPDPVILDERERAERKTYLAACGLLLLLNVSLIVPISLMVVQQKPVRMTLIPAIAMAAYTTYKITMASIHLRRRRRTRNRFVRLLRTVSFIDALVSILTLQNTLIMVSSNGGDMGMLPLTAASSAAVWLSTLGLSAAALAHGIREGTG